MKNNISVDAHPTVTYPFATCSLSCSVFRCASPIDLGLTSHNMSHDLKSKTKSA